MASCIAIATVCFQKVGCPEYNYTDLYEHQVEVHDRLVCGMTPSYETRCMGNTTS